MSKPTPTQPSNVLDTIGGILDLAGQGAEVYWKFAGQQNQDAAQPIPGTPSMAGSPGSGLSPVLIGGVLLLGGVGIYAMSKNKK